MMSPSSARQAHVAVAHLVTFLGSRTQNGAIPCDESNLTAAAERLCQLVGARQVMLEGVTDNGRTVAATGKGLPNTSEPEQWRLILREALPKVATTFSLQRITVSIEFANGFLARRDYPYTH